MEIGNITFGIDNFFTQSRVETCMNYKCKFNLEGECQMKIIYLNEFGMCGCKEVGSND